MTIILQNRRFVLQIRQLISLIMLGLLVSLTISGCKFEYSVDGVPVSKSDTHSDVQPKESGKTTARVMTYNIQYFNREAAEHGNRVEKLQQIVKEINPTVVAVEEVDDRAAMELVFPKEDWLVVIDDDSGDRQDVAVAVRRPWSVTGVADDLDADDENFLGEGHKLDKFFPKRRDALFVGIQSPGGGAGFTVVVVHAKARVGGRAKTEYRRVGAARELVKDFKTVLKDRDIVVMGDFNDAPDDISLNILETGDPNAKAGDNAWPSEFLVNLTQPLWEKNMVTEGANEHRLDRGSGLLNVVYPEARERNTRGRGRDAGTGPIMFDQILVSNPLTSNGATAKIYRNPIALTGPGFSRPSDHLPVYADIEVP